MLLNSRELLKRFVHIGTSWCPNIDMSSYRLNLTTKACHILYFFSLWRVHACTTPDECLHELSVSIECWCLFSSWHELRRVSIIIRFRFHLVSSAIVFSTHRCIYRISGAISYFLAMISHVLSSSNALFSFSFFFFFFFTILYIIFYNVVLIKFFIIKILTI